MPIRAFWIASGFVERLQADEAKLELQVGSAVGGSQKNREEFYGHLEAQAPEPIVYTGHAKLNASAPRDEDASERLRRLSG